MVPVTAIWFPFTKPLPVAEADPLTTFTVPLAMPKHIAGGILVPDTTALPLVILRGALPLFQRKPLAHELSAPLQFRSRTRFRPSWVFHSSWCAGSGSNSAASVSHAAMYPESRLSESLQPRPAIAAPDLARPLKSLHEGRFGSVVSRTAAANPPIPPPPIKSVMPPASPPAIGGEPTKRSLNTLAACR